MGIVSLVTRFFLRLLLSFSWKSKRYPYTCIYRFLEGAQNDWLHRHDLHINAFSNLVCIKKKHYFLIETVIYFSSDLFQSLLFNIICINEFISYKKIYLFKLNFRVIDINHLYFKATYEYIFIVDRMALESPYQII